MGEGGDGEKLKNTSYVHFFFNEVKMLRKKICF